MLGRLALDVVRLVREKRAGRMDPFAPRLEHRRDRMLGEPVDLEVRMERAQLVGDRRVSLRVPEPDWGRDEERALAAGLAPHPTPRRRGRGHEVADEQVDLDRVAGMGEMSRPLEDDELAARQLREPRPGSARPHGVVASVDHEHRALDPGEELPHALLVLEPGRQLSGDERLGVGLETPADAVLPRLRRVRLGEALGEEELEEVFVVLDPVVAVPLSPADVLVAQLAEVLDRLQARSRRGQRQRRRDEDELVDPLGVARRQVQRPLGPP